MYKIKTLDIPIQDFFDREKFPIIYIDCFPDGFTITDLQIAACKNKQSTPDFFDIIDINAVKEAMSKDTSYQLFLLKIALLNEQGVSVDEIVKNISDIDSLFAKYNSQNNFKDFLIE